MALSSLALKDRPVQVPDWLIEGFLKRGNTAIMMGQPKKACKSWLLLEMAWDLSEGKNVWGMRNAKGEPIFQPPRPLRSVYFTQEDTEDDIAERMKAHFARKREPNDRLWIVPKNLQMTLDTGYEHISRELNEVQEKSGQIDLVIFDPMRRMHNGNENDSDVIGRLWARVNEIQKKWGVGVMFAHHTVKPPQDRTGYDQTDPFTGRGSSDIYGGGDAFAVVVPGARTVEAARVGVWFESKRAANPDPAQLKVTFATGGVEWMGTGFEPKGPRDI